MPLPPSCLDPLPGRVPARLTRHLEPDPLPEDLDFPARPDGRLGRQVRVGDGALDGEARAAGRDPADDRLAEAHRLVAEANGAHIVEDEAAQALAGPGGL